MDKKVLGILLGLAVISTSRWAVAGDPSLFAMNDSAFRGYATSELPELIQTMQTALAWKAQAGYGDESFASAASKQSVDIVDKEIQKGSSYADAKIRATYEAAATRSFGVRYVDAAEKCTDIEKAAKGRASGKTPPWLVAIFKKYGAASCATVKSPVS